mgnify:CR=1 FL=1
MSFASGLFSFMGGMSKQYREEVDTEAAIKASIAAAKEESRRWALEQQSEKDKFDFEVTKFDFEKDKFDQEFSLKEDVHNLNVLKAANAKSDSIADRSLKRDELNFKIDSFTKTHNLNKDKFILTENEFTQAKKEFMEKMGLSEKEYELNKLEYDETVRYNKEKIRIDEYEAMMDAEAGVSTYRGLKKEDDLKISFVGDTENERLFSALSQFDALSNEQIKKLTPESQELLQQNIKQALGQLKLKSYDDTNKTYIDFTQDYKNLFNLDILNTVFDEVMDSIKSDVQEDLKKDGIKADSVALSTDGSRISASPINFDEWAAQAGFETPQQLLVSVDSLIAHNNTKQSFSGNLSPFRSRESLYMTMKQENIPFNLLQLSEEFNYLQELPMDASVNSQFYIDLYEKAEEIGIIGSNGEGAEHLYNFIYKVQPQGEVIAIGGVIKTAITPKEAGKDVDVKAASDQYEAASTAIRTVDEMILRIDSLRDDALFGLPMTAASLFEKAKSTAEGVQLLLGKVQSDEIKMTAGARQKFIEGLNKISETQMLAEESAKIQYLKFSLAYQMSMALQGGSGGRTISDQDVDNMLRALNMDAILGIADANQVKASLGTIRTFMSGISNKAYYQSLNNMKGYRTHRHVVGMMDAMSIDTLEKLAQELEDKVYGEQDDIENLLTSDVAQLIGINNWDSSETINGVPEFSVFQKDGYPYIVFLDPNKGAYFLTQEMFDNYKQSEKGKKSKLTENITKIPEGQFPTDLTSLGGRTIQNPNLIGQ